MAIENESKLMWDLDTYRQWRLVPEKQGCTPMEMAEQYEKIGMVEYARKLREVIEKWEESDQCMDSRIKECDRTQCPVCGRDVSSKWHYCPKCGAALTKETS